MNIDAKILNKINISKLNSAVLYNSGPQHFWHQGLVSWKTIFPWTGVGWGDGSGSNVSDKK